MRSLRFVSTAFASELADYGQSFRDHKKNRLALFKMLWRPQTIFIDLLPNWWVSKGRGACQFSSE